MPLKIQKEEPQAKKKHDLGLEIFELKKEMGMFGGDKQQVSIDKILTERSKRKQLIQIQKQFQKYQEEQAQIYQKKKYQENPQRQKLIHDQHKKRIKLQKKEKIMQLINQQRVLSNLKTLNEITEQKRILKKKENVYRDHQSFKTVQDQDKQLQFKKINKSFIQNQQNMQSFLEHNKSVQQQRQRPKSNLQKTTPDQKAKRTLKIKQNNNVQQMPVSSRRSLINLQNNKIKIKIPKAKILYSSVNQDQNNLVQSKEKRQNNSHTIEQRRSSQSKKRLIQLILKSVELQQQNQDSSRHAMKSKSRSHKKRKKPTISSTNNQNNIISIETPLQIQNNQYFQSQYSMELNKQAKYSPQKQHKEYADIQQQSVDGDVSFQSDNIVIDDQLMIFCIQTTAASIIQKNFRNYLQRKKRKNIEFEIKEEYNQQIENNNFKDIDKNQLSESTKLENRFVAIKEDSKRKISKHTFSFGNYDEHHLSQNLPIQDSLLNQQLSQKQQQKSVIEDNSFRLDSSPVQDQQTQFFINSQKIEKNKFNYPDEESKDQSVLTGDSQNYDKVIKINDKFKYALRSLAEKQKQMNIFDQIKVQQQSKRQNIPQSKVKDYQIQNAQKSDLQKELDQIYELSKQKSNKKQSIFIHENSNSSRKKDSKDKQNFIRSLQDDINNINLDRDDNQAELSRVSIDEDFDSELEKFNQQNSMQQKQPLRQNESILSSLLASKGEQTDKIMLYSPINTNEELIEAAVNESNTLNNEESMIINDSNVQSKIDESNTQSRVDDSQRQISSSDKQQSFGNDINKEEIKIENFVNQPIFDYKIKKQNENYYSLNSMEPESQDNQIVKAQSARKFSVDEDYKFDLNDFQNHYSQQHTQNQESKKSILRLMFGDEKFLLENENNLNLQSIEGSPRGGSAPSSHRMLMSENPYFLATNTSIFERNPFKEFTTNKLQEILAGKNYEELTQIKDEALQYQEKLEKGFINRLEKKEELSPKSSQRRKYELERWVSSERKKVQTEKPDKPLNFLELEQERKEAAQIIEHVNNKAKQIKISLQQEILQQDQIIHIQDYQSQNIQQSSLNDEEIKSDSKLDLSAEVQKIVIEKTLQSNQNSRMPEISQQNEITNNSLTQNDKEDLHTIALEISFEEEDEIYERTQSQNDEYKQNHKDNLLSQISLEKEQLVDELVDNILKDILLPEAEKLITLIMSLNEDQKKQKKEIIASSETIISKQISTNQFKRQGIDTSEETIEQYINDIFSQITMRRDQFLQAFITPIYKNPLEVLANIQRPDFGEIEIMDFTNSLAYILNVQLYLTLEKARENLQNAFSEDDLTDLISEAQHIHNKVLFDCVNEALNSERPYANQGEPMPWSKKPRKNLLFMFDSTENLEIILQNVKSKVMEWARTKAGAIPPREFYNHDTQLQLQIDEENFAHQREKSLAQMLAQDVQLHAYFNYFQLILQEGKWLDYELEETQVKIDLSDIVLEHLIGETVEILNIAQIQLNRENI